MSGKANIILRRIGLALVVGLVTTTFVDRAELQAQARGRATSNARSSVHASNTNVNVNRNVNVNVHDTHHYDRWGHPIAAAAAVTATAVAVGTVVASLPPKCSVIVTGNVTYQNCGGVYYQPVYQGTSVQYVVIDHP